MAPLKGAFFQKAFDAKLATNLKQICPKLNKKSAQSTPLQKIDENKVPIRCQKGAGQDK